MSRPAEPKAWEYPRDREERFEQTCHSGDDSHRNQKRHRKRHRDAQGIRNRQLIRAEHKYPNARRHERYPPQDAGRQWWFYSVDGRLLRCEASGKVVVVVEDHRQRHPGGGQESDGHGQRNSNRAYAHGETDETNEPHRRRNAYE